MRWLLGHIWTGTTRLIFTTHLAHSIYSNMIQQMCMHHTFGDFIKVMYFGVSCVRTTCSDTYCAATVAMANKYGLFSEPTYNAVGDPYTGKEPVADRLKGLNFKVTLELFRQGCSDKLIKPSLALLNKTLFLFVRMTYHRELYCVLSWWNCRWVWASGWRPCAWPCLEGFP